MERVTLYPTTRSDVQNKLCSCESTLLGLSVFTTESHKNKAILVKQLDEAFDVCFNTLANKPEGFRWGKYTKTSFGAVHSSTESAVHLYGRKEKIFCYEAECDGIDDYALLIVQIASDESGIVKYLFYGYKRKAGD